MRNTVLWRKQARIIMALASELSISEERALDLLFLEKSVDNYKIQRVGGN